MEPTLRASRLGDSRFTASGLTADEADAPLPDLLKYAEQSRTAVELRGRFEELPGAPVEPTAWRLLR